MCDYDADERTNSEILGLNAEAIWFGALYAMQTMLSGFQQWEMNKIENGNDDIAADFARRVSFLHEKTLIPVTLSIKNNHVPPSFAVNALKNISNRNQIFDLHVKLLFEASKNLIGFGIVGRSIATVTEIEKWFAVLKRAAQAFESQSLASDDAVTELKQVVESFEMQILEMEKDTTDKPSSPRGHKEPCVFFCHKFLFIRIAYMVEFYTNATTKMLNQSKNKGYTFLTPSKDHRKRWGTFSGNLIQMLFKKDVRGLPVLNRETTNAGYIEKCTEKGLFNFPMLNCLPYKEFFQLTVKNRGKPSLPELQESIVCEMFGNIRRKCIAMGHSHRSCREQLERLQNIFSVAVSTAENELNTLQNREKVRRCLNKKNKARHHPGNQSTARSRRIRKRQGPDKFIWDVFIMGTDSYYHQFNDFNGKALREFHKKCNARDQLQRNYEKLVSL